MLEQITTGRAEFNRAGGYFYVEDKTGRPELDSSNPSGRCSSAAWIRTPFPTPTCRGAMPGGNVRVMSRARG